MPLAKASDAHALKAGKTAQGLTAVKRALISVSDKTGLLEFAAFLASKKVEIFSTGGTLAALKKAGIAVRGVEELTGFPEIMDGRVKTLHPKIHGGLLYRRDKKTHADQAREHGIQAIDLVVVNLYPFEAVTRDPAVDLETAIENIDIGGPSMLRSAAKNHEAVTVVTDPADYASVTKEMETHKGKVSAGLRFSLALKVFERTSAYDGAIASFLKTRAPGTSGPSAASAAGETAELPAALRLDYTKVSDLRYGENPHQKAAFYAAKGQSGPAFRQLHGKELSFNNLLDIEATVEILKEFDAPAACVVKHNNPCGVAQAGSPADALRQAIECDLMSAFGGIVGLNRPCDKETAEAAFDMLRFFEVLAAPAFEPAALKFLQGRPNLRLIETAGTGPENPCDLRVLGSGLLVQTRDPALIRDKAFKKKIRFVTQAKLEDSRIDELFFAFKCVKVVKSNAIVITQGFQTVGIGAGQMSRVDSVEIACRKAGYRTDGGILASDAFFPMPDSIEVAHQYAIRAIIQPGGSVRDADVIAACDRFGIAMAFTGQRHFRH